MENILSYNLYSYRNKIFVSGGFEIGMNAGAQGGAQGGGQGGGQGSSQG